LPFLQDPAAAPTARQVCAQEEQQQREERGRRLRELTGECGTLLQGAGQVQSYLWMLEFPALTAARVSEEADSGLLQYMLEKSCGPASKVRLHTATAGLKQRYHCYFG
jgi:hypothetical protein